nr:hypothetical protein [Tanacetum cinerariifolium]
IPEFDPKGDPEEDDEEDPEEDPADYLSDSTVVALLAVNHVPSEEVTEPLPQILSPLLPIQLPPPNSPTHIEILESCLPLRKRLHFASPTPTVGVAATGNGCSSAGKTSSSGGIYSGYTKQVRVVPALAPPDQACSL